MRVSQGTLSAFLKLHAIGFLAYGLGFLLIPDFTLSLFRYPSAHLPATLWTRAVGVPFIALAIGEYLCDRRLSERLDLVWIFPVVPALYLVTFIWERAAGTFEGGSLFFWGNMGVFVFFLLGVGGSRLLLKES